MTKPMPMLTEEEIARWQDSIRGAPDREEGFGALKTPRGCLPLEALDVRAHVNGLLARTEVTQTFVNGHDEPLEATYIFPLPDRAAVTRFRLEVAGRVIEGQLKERDEARREYDRAVRTGHRAALAEEDRPGVFTMKVGNLPPRERAVVRLTLTGPLPYSDGETTYRFPLVVAPRYIPGTPLPGPPVGEGVAEDTDAVPDASRISPPVLLPGFPNPVRLSLSVAFAAAGPRPTALRSSLHAVTEEGEGRTRLVRLQPGERLDRDFLLRFRLAEQDVVTALSVHPDADGAEGTFALTLVPPASDLGSVRPRDVVFVLDRSGSMAGWKMVAARRAVARMIDTLTDADRFAVLAFDDHAETPPGLPGSQLAPATDRHRFCAVEFLSRVSERGGTEMAQPLDLAVRELDRDPEGRRRDRVLVLITDGQVGNEDQILRELGGRLKGIRVFTLGIDRAVNAAFLNRLAEIGGGGSEVVESEDRLDEVMAQVHRRIGTPVLTGLRLEPAGLSFVPGSLVPERLPDLFTGTPVVILGRYRGRPEGAVALQARDSSGQAWSATVTARRDDSAAPATVWARGKLRALEDRYAAGQGNSASLQKEIVALSLRFGVLCRFTAFVAVDRTEVVNPGGQSHKIVQPVEMPQGWGEKAEELLSVCRGAPAMDAEDMPLSKLRFFARSKDSTTDLALFDAAAEGLEEESLFETDAELPAPLPPRSRKAKTRSSSRSGTRGGIGHRGGPDRAGKPAHQAWDAAADPATLFRKHVGEVRQAMRAVTAADAASRLAWLRQHAAELEQLPGEFAASCNREPSTERLLKAVAEVLVLCKEPRPSDERVDRAWVELTAALEECQEAWGMPPDRREAFWK